MGPLYPITYMDEDTPRLSLIQRDTPKGQPPKLTPPALLPSILDQVGLTIPEPIVFDDPDQQLTEVRRADIQLFNTQLHVLHSLWTEVKSIQTALSLVKQTTDMIKLRRDILGLEYGAPKDTSANRTFPPLE